MAIVRAVVVAVMAVGCAAFPARREARGPTRAAAPVPRPAVPLAGPPEPAGTGAGEAAPPLAIDREDRRPVPEVLAETDGWLLGLARLHGAEGQRRAAEVLANLATLARRLDGTAAMEERAREIEEEARALATDPGWFGRTDRARSGLLASVAALERIAERQAPELRPWIAAARAAVEAIREENPFGIERIVVQDGFRAVVDAFRAAAQRETARRS